MNSLFPIVTTSIILAGGFSVGPASSQIRDMEPTRYYFQQMGRLAGTMGACRKHFCEEISRAQPSLGQFCIDAAGMIATKAFSELESCGATADQIRELSQVFNAEVSTYQQIPCPLNFNEARTKYNAVMDAIKQRSRVGTSCIRP